MADPPVTDNADAPPPDGPRPETLPALELRVRRLEDAFAAIQDTGEMEDRVVRRLAERLRRNGGDAIPTQTEVIIDAGRPLLPVLTAPPPAPDRPVPEPSPQHWLLVEALLEARAMWRMFFDPRYRLTWRASVFPIPLLVAILTSWLWLHFLPGFGLLPGMVATLVVKAVDLGLAFVLFKLLHREATRYRQQIAD